MSDINYDVRPDSDGFTTAVERALEILTRREQVAREAYRLARDEVERAYRDGGPGTGAYRSAHLEQERSRAAWQEAKQALRQVRELRP